LAGISVIMTRTKGYTLVELLTVVFIVIVLASVAVPILRGRIDAAKWSEGKALAGTISMALRTYVVGTAELGPWDEISLPAEKLGITAQDLGGRYFREENFHWNAQKDGTFLITVDKPPEIAAPAQITLDNRGNWVP
jgi:type II secretory pathway pseudopilin PulG